MNIVNESQRQQSDYTNKLYELKEYMKLGGKAPSSDVGIDCIEIEVLYHLGSDESDDIKYYKILAYLFDIYCSPFVVASVKRHSSKSRALRMADDMISVLSF